MRVYLAGPEVFLPDAREILATKAALSRARGFQPVTTLDNDLPPGGDRFATTSHMTPFRIGRGVMLFYRVFDRHQVLR